MTTRTKSLHGPHVEPVLATVANDMARPFPYPERGKVTITVITLMNGTWSSEVSHDDLLRLMAEYCDHLYTGDHALGEPDNGPTKEFLTARIVISHIVSDRATGSSIETWPWVHDLVDAVLADALNDGLRLPPGHGPWHDGAFANVTHVHTEWPTF